MKNLKSLNGPSFWCPRALARAAVGPSSAITSPPVNPQQSHQRPLSTPPANSFVCLNAQLSADLAPACPFPGVYRLLFVRDDDVRGTFWNRITGLSPDPPSFAQEEKFSIINLVDEEETPVWWIMCPVPLPQGVRVAGDHQDSEADHSRPA